jgi:glucose/arabinose dehydrogenase
VVSISLAAPVAGDTATAPPPSNEPRAQAVPKFKVRTVVGGLRNAWDVAELPGGALLVTERDKARLSIVRKGRRRTVQFASNRVWRSGETGLMSVELAADWATSRTFYTCSGWKMSSGRPEIQVRYWRLVGTARAVARGKLLGAIPTDSGRHGGCRITVDRASGDIWVGTGDAALTGTARDLTSLAGKVLRMDAWGQPSAANPWVTATDPQQRYVFSYGHRNVQGLALRADGTMWSVEHGSYRDDEVNLVTAGSDGGWDPGPGYDESVPMTDQSLPGLQTEARWSSGPTTAATSGAEWVRGKQWGALNGTLAVATLKGEQLMFLRFDASGKFVRSYEPKALGKYGRLRSVTRAANGDLLVTTDNGTDDRVLRVSPR